MYLRIHVCIAYVFILTYINKYVLTHNPKHQYCTLYSYNRQHTSYSQLLVPTTVPLILYQNTCENPAKYLSHTITRNTKPSLGFKVLIPSLKIVIHIYFKSSFLLRESEFITYYCVSWRTSLRHARICRCLPSLSEAGALARAVGLCLVLLSLCLCLSV